MIGSVVVVTPSGEVLVESGVAVESAESGAVSVLESSLTLVGLLSERGETEDGEDWEVEEVYELVEELLVGVVDDW